VYYSVCVPWRGEHSNALFKARTAMDGFVPTASNLTCYEPIFVRTPAVSARGPTGVLDWLGWCGSRVTGAPLLDFFFFAFQRRNAFRFARRYGATARQPSLENLVSADRPPHAMTRVIAGDDISHSERFGVSPRCTSE